MATKQHKPKWTRRSSERPQEIVAAALDLFSERGFAATRLDDVAQRAGVSKATIYLYFKNKEELFFAIVRENILPHVDEAETLFAQFKGSRSELIRLLIQHFGAMMAERRIGAVIKLILSESGNFPHVVDYYYENVIQRGIGLLSRIIEIGIEEGEFKPCAPRDAAKLIAFPVVMANVWAETFGHQEPIDRAKFLQLHAETVLSGLAVAGKGGSNA